MAMAVETMAAQGWSSLPADLVNRVADCLLATNDLDCYTDLRAVCHHWRSVTADPRSNQHDPRFRPYRWVMLDEQKASSAAAIAVDGALLFVNTATGRFLRRSLLLLRDPSHNFITSTTDGLLVLAATDTPHAVSVLNPFTGSLLRFAAPLPSEQRPRLRLTADVVGPSPALVLVSVGRSWVYWAESQSESFSIDKSHRDCPASRLPQIIAAGEKCAAAVNREPTVPAGVKNIFDQLRSVDYDEDCRCYAVVAAGGAMLAVLKRRRGMDVFKIDAAGNVMERVKSIGSQALFLGVRCLVVDTDCFPTVEPNCAYFQLTDLDDDQNYIYKFSIGTYGDEEEPELVSAAMSNTTVSPRTMGPFTVTQLLCIYTMDIPGQQLTWEGYSYDLELEGYYGGDGHYDKYIDYVNNESDEDWGSDYDYRPDDDCYNYLFDKDVGSD